ncbi:MAG: class 1 isoprenoid biosynthesis enzyme [Armatimonadota bacterium]
MGLDSLFAGVHRRTEELAREFSVQFHPVVRDALVALFDEPDIAGRSKVFPYTVFVATAADAGLFDIETISRINFAGACGNTYYSLLDRIVDNKEQLCPERLNDLMLADLLLYKFWEEIKEYYPTDDFWRFVPPLFTDAAEAMFIEEVLHVSKLTVYEKDELKYLAHKSIPLTSVFQAIFYAANKPHFACSMRELVLHTCFGLQLLDDLRDWDEDLARKRFTYPLQRAIEAEELTLAECFTEDGKSKIARSVFLGPVYHEVVNIAIDSLKHAYELATGNLLYTSEELMRYIGKAHSDYETALRRQASIYLAHTQGGQNAN